MPARPTADRESEALSRFQADERALEAGLEEARRAAGSIVAAAQAEADAIRSAAREEAARIDAQVKEDAAAACRREVEEFSGVLAREVEEIAARSRANEARALEWLVAVVAGDPVEHAP